MTKYTDMFDNKPWLAFVSMAIGCMVGITICIGLGIIKDNQLSQSEELTTYHHCSYNFNESGDDGLSFSESCNQTSFYVFYTDGIMSIVYFDHNKLNLYYDFMHLPDSGRVRLHITNDTKNIVQEYKMIDETITDRFEGMGDYR